MTGDHPAHRLGIQPQGQRQPPGRAVPGEPGKMKKMEKRQWTAFVNELVERELVGFVMALIDNNQKGAGYHTPLNIGIIMSSLNFAKGCYPPIALPLVAAWLNLIDAPGPEFSADRGRCRRYTCPAETTPYRTVVDKTQELLPTTPEKAMVREFTRVGRHVNKISPRQIYRTGTMPISKVRALKTAIGLEAEDHSNLEIHRSETTRRNMSYRYELTPTREAAIQTAQSLAAELTKGRKAIFYVFNVSEGHEMARGLGCDMY
ncbi:hypothetical protein V8F33_004521 [Rhypophila sp. PSN 637]